MIMLTSQVREVTRTDMRAVNYQGKNADNVGISHHFTTRSNSCVFSGITEAGQRAHHGVLLALASAQEPVSKESSRRRRRSVCSRLPRLGSNFQKSAAIGDKCGHPRVCRSMYKHVESIMCCKKTIENCAESR